MIKLVVVDDLYRYAMVSPSKAALQAMVKNMCLFNDAVGAQPHILTAYTSRLIAKF